MYLSVIIALNVQNRNNARKTVVWLRVKNGITGDLKLAKG